MLKFVTSRNVSFSLFFEWIIMLMMLLMHFYVVKKLQLPYCCTLLGGYAGEASS